MRQRYSDRVNKLLESKRPSLRILLEEEEKKETKKDEKGKEKKDSNNDLFADLNLGGEEKDQDKLEDKNLDHKQNDDDKLDDKSKPQEDEDDGKEDNEEEISAKVDAELRKRFKNQEFVEDAKEPSKRDFKDVLDKSLFGESFLRRSKLKDNFHLQEKRIFKIQKMLKENSLASQLSELDISVDELVNNAINLTKNFIDKIDIPELIMDHIANRFAEKAAEEEDDSVANSYRLKLEEFIEKYLRKLVTVDDYKNYDASGYIMKNEPAMKTAVGARPTT